MDGNLEESIKIEATDSRVSEVMEHKNDTALEAILFASPNPLTEAQLARLMGCDKRQVPLIIDRLNYSYLDSGRSFRIERFGDCFRLYTLPEFDKYISRLAEIPRPARLSRAALEVLAIVAYRQPIVKSEIEKIRGIESDGVIRTLLERGFLTVAGKSDAPGRPLLYKTTQEFLEFFGISDLSELPEVAVPETEIPKTITLVRPPEEPNSADEAE
ncbi:MAG TPA: SMC-Scp complex subunit ScpB [candidate division Zixibacteria bacterium]|nr:SMC-Scp complex subunit ScpB [candidate division Zixibacteria bacterium]